MCTMRVMLILMIFDIIAMSTANESTHDKILVCPVSTQTVLDEVGNDFNIQNANLELCSHLIVMDKHLMDEEFLSVHNHARINLSDNQIEHDHEEFSNVLKKYPHLKILLNEYGIGVFQTFLESLTDSNPHEFLKYAARYFKQHNFHGTNLDFQYLQNSSKLVTEQSDWDKMETFLNELKKTFKKYDLLVTASITVAANNLSTDHHFYRLFKYFDFVHVQQPKTFGDRFSAKLTNALFELDSVNIMQNVDYIIDLIMDWQISPTRIVLGLNLCGPTCSVKCDDNIDVMTISGYTNYDGICKLMTQSSNYEILSEPTNELLIVKETWEHSLENRILIHRKTRSFANLVKFAVERNLAGVMCYSIEWDDLDGNCKIDNDTFVDFTGAMDLKIDKGRYTLLRTIHKALYLAVQDVSQVINDTPIVNVPVLSMHESGHVREEESNENEQIITIEIVEINENENENNEPNNGCASDVRRHSFSIGFLMIGFLFTLIVILI